MCFTLLNISKPGRDQTERGRVRVDRWIMARGYFLLINLNIKLQGAYIASDTICNVIAVHYHCETLIILYAHFTLSAVMIITASCLTGESLNWVLFISIIYHHWLLLVLLSIFKMSQYWLEKSSTLYHRDFFKSNASTTYAWYVFYFSVLDQSLAALMLT